MDRREAYAATPYGRLWKFRTKELDEWVTLDGAGNNGQLKKSDDKNSRPSLETEDA